METNAEDKSSRKDGHICLRVRWSGSESVSQVPQESISEDSVARAFGATSSPRVRKIRGQDHLQPRLGNPRR